VAPEGYIVTNDHVVGSAERISVTLNDGSQHSARLIGRDSRTDLALLKIDAKEPLPFVRFAGSEPRVGDWVVAVGSPFGLGNTVTAGIVSAHGRSVGSDGPFEGFMQIDAAINPGNSGGPAFNVKGEVVGVNTAIFTPSGGNVGIGFAVPADTAAMTIASLRESGRVERGWLGVSIQEVTPDLAEGFGLKEVRGALISKVSPESPAAKAGMREGDIVVRVNGAAVAAVRDLPRLVGSLKAGDAASIEVVRNGKIQNLTATVGRSPERDQVAGTQAPANAGLGLALAALDPSMRRNFGIGDNVDGVLIAAVRPDSAAAEEGLRAGDVIVAVGPSRVTQPAEIQDAVRLAERDRRKTVVLRVARGDYERFVALPIQPA
jgi:serine protease Do